MTTPTNEQVEKLLNAIEYIVSHPEEGSGDVHADVRKVVTEAILTAQSATMEELIYEVRKVLAFEGVLSMSVEKALSELSPNSGAETPYSQRDHRHCPDTNSPCGFEGKHRCCLCGAESK